MKRKKEERNKERKEEQSSSSAKLSHLHLYYEAFKIDKQFGMTVLLDAAYLFTLFGLFLLFLGILQAVLLPLAAALQYIFGLFMASTAIGANGAMNSAMEISLSKHVSTITWFYAKFALLVIVGIAVFLGINSLYKAFIWLHITKQKHTAQYLKKFVAINMTWQALWLLAAIIIFLGFTVKAAAAGLTILLFAYLYFTAFFRALLQEKHTMKKIYKETFVFGVKKFRHFTVPICMMFITIIFSWMIGVIILTIVAPFALFIFGMAFIILAVSWMRFYFYVVTKKVLKIKSS